MKTNLPAKIQTTIQAQAFLNDLYTHNEAFHPQEDAHGVNWLNEDEAPTPTQCDQLNALMRDIYALPSEFDPCEYLFSLYKKNQ